MADEATSDAMPEAAGGEGGHGAAKLDPLIHSYGFYHRKTHSIALLLNKS